MLVLTRRTDEKSHQQQSHRRGFEFAQQHGFQHSFRENGDLGRDHPGDRRLPRRNHRCGLDRGTGEHDADTRGKVDHHQRRVGNIARRPVWLAAGQVLEAERALKKKKRTRSDA